MSAMRRSSLLVASCGMFALAACGSDEPEVAEGSAQSAEVLEGSISDDMIALEKVQSEAPLLEGSNDGDGDSSDDGGDDSEADAAE